jgi:hypothetical protein
MCGIMLIIVERKGKFSEGERDEGYRIVVQHVHSPRLKVSASPDYEAAAVPGQILTGNSSLEAYQSLGLVPCIAWSSGPPALRHGRLDSCHHFYLQLSVNSRPIAVWVFAILGTQCCSKHSSQ